jgi:hypothetical protein
MSTENTEAQNPATPAPQAPQQPPKPVLLIDRVKATEELSQGIANFIEKQLGPQVKATEELSQGIANFIEKQLGPQVNALNNTSQGIIEIVNALVVLGGDGFESKVQAQVEKQRKERLQKEVDAQKAALQKLVEQGVLVPAATIGEKTIVVGRELDKDKNPVGRGYVQVEFGQFTLEMKGQLAGNSAGFVAALPENNGFFEVLEAYDFKETPAPATASETPAAQ